MILIANLVIYFEFDSGADSYLTAAANSNGMKSKLFDHHMPTKVTTYSFNPSEGVFSFLTTRGSFYRVVPSITYSAQPDHNGRLGIESLQVINDINTTLERALQLETKSYSNFVTYKDIIVI